MSLKSILGDAWQALKEQYQGFTGQEVDAAWRGLHSDLYQKFITPASVSDAIGTYFNPNNPVDFNKALADKLCAHIRDADPREDTRVYKASYYDGVDFNGSIGDLEISDNRLEIFNDSFREAQTAIPTLSKVCSAIESSIETREVFHSGLKDAARRERQKDKDCWTAHDRRMRDAQAWLKSARGGPL